MINNHSKQFYLSLLLKWVIFRIVIVVHFVNVPLSLLNVIFLCSRDCFYSHFGKLLDNGKEFEVSMIMKRPSKRSTIVNC